ncbi:hypothetical protein Q1695_015251 [Nippostrongylus brasiliensis]|nr:hypothetical protein Q1695_015251 [Nippostrongylus brasiliensis]
MVVSVSSVLRWILMATVNVILLISTGLANVCFEEQIRATCQQFNTTVVMENCSYRRHTAFLFVVFCAVRAASYKVETIFTKKNSTCIARKQYPGRHLGFMLGIPFLVRHLLLSAGMGETMMTYACSVVLSLLAFYPYAKDFFLLCRLVGYAIQRRFYNGNQDIILTFVALYVYMSIVLIEALDVSAGLYCAQHFLGFPLLFPNINFPLSLFHLHTFVVTKHKPMPTIIYEVVDEDCFIQLQRMRCLCLKDCPDLSSAIRLPIKPSLSTTKERRSMAGRVVQVLLILSARKWAKTAPILMI